MASSCIKCNPEMCRFTIAAALVIVLSVPSVGTPDKIEHNVSTEFSSDQIAVYSFILNSYRALLKPTYRDMLANNFYLEDETAGPLDLEELKAGQGYLKGIDLEPIPSGGTSIVHRIIGQKWLPSYVKSAHDVKCVNSSPSEPHICWQTEGALSLSEIRFDKNHRYALVGMGVRCGMQCGWGQLLLLEKVHGRWHRKAICLEIYI